MYICCILITHILNSCIPLVVSPRNYSLTPAANTTLSSSPARRQPTPTKNLTAAAGEHVYVFPAEPPPKDKWIPDAAVSKCMACNVERFSMVSSYHQSKQQASYPLLFLTTFKFMPGHVHIIVKGKPDLLEKLAITDLLWTNVTVN